MELGTIDAVINQIGSQVAGSIGTLQDVGLGIAYPLGVLTILFFGMALATSQTALLTSTFMAMGAITLTTWLILLWPGLVMDTRAWTHEVIGRLLGAVYAGPSTVFRLAGTMIRRMGAEQMSVWTAVSNPLNMLAAGFAMAMTFLGFCVAGILAVLAEIEFLIGCAVAPLLLPGLAFSVSASFGWGALRYLVFGSIKIIILGGIATIMANAITGVIYKPGAAEFLTEEQIWTVFGLSLLMMVLSVGGYMLPSQILAGSPGTLGLGSVSQAGGVVTGSVSAATNVAGRVAGTVAAGGGAAARAGTRAATVARSSGLKSAFGR